MSRPAIQSWRLVVPHPAVLMLALLIVGMLAVYALARAEGVSIGPHQVEHSRVSWVVFDGHTVGQVFRIDPAQTVGVRLWLTFPQGRPTGTINARLRSFDLERDIASTRLPISEINADGATDFRFDSVDAAGWMSSEPLTVELIVSTESVPEDQAIAALGSTNRYPNGPLVIDGDQYPGEDLAFAALYPGSVADMLLPITHMAEGRPGMFGWPPLYAMLAWLMVWLALALLVGFARSTREWRAE